MWFATQDGLNQFDGTRIIRYVASSDESSHRILGSDVYDMVIEESGNNLWCLTAYGGLSKINLITGDVVETFPLPRHPHTGNPLWFQCMSIKNSSIYIGTNEGLYLKFNTSNRNTDIGFVQTTGILHSVDKIFADDYAHIWFFISNVGMLIKDTSCKKDLTIIPADKLGNVHTNNISFKDICKLDSNLLLICSTSGLTIADLKNISLRPTNHLLSNISPDLLYSSLYCISVLGNTILLAGEMGLFLIDRSSNKIEKVSANNLDINKNWLTIINSIAQSGETIWIGSTYGVGWVKNRNNPISSFYSSLNGNGVKIEHSITLFNHNDSVIVACGDDGMYYSNHLEGTITKFSIPDCYYHAFKAPGNYILASGIKKGLQLSDEYFRPASLGEIFPELMPIQKQVFISSAVFEDSIYFLVDQNNKGIYIWNYKTKKIRLLNADSKPIALKSNIINRVYVDKRKKIWIVGDNTVSVYDFYNNTIEHLDLNNSLTNEPISINMDICETGDKYWIASYGTGILELNSEKKLTNIYSAKDGINNLGLYKIFKINDSTIIASSNNGLSVLSIGNDRRAIINYFEEDGLQSNNFEETSGCETEKFIFFGGLRGFTKIIKANFTIRKKSYGFYFTSIQIHQPTKITDTSNLFINRLKIPDNAIQVVINFTSLNYVVPEKIKFQYRLKEINEKWNSIGSQRFITLIGIFPGAYTLQVRVANEDGSWSDPIELTLIFLPKWYQTWWFKSLLALTAITIGYGLYRLRINQLKKEEKIRSRLASDLHDDLGSTLNSIKVYSNLALMQRENSDHLIKIKQSTQDAISGIRDIIWVLDDKKDTVEDLLNRVKQFAVPLCDANGVRFITDADSAFHHHKLGKEEKRNLYMILKESINNSIKYAGCSTIRLQLMVETRKLKIEISDDGRGFDNTKNNEGNGLKNINTRAKEIGYSSRIISSPGQGTRVILAKN
jgi:two-component sensor histidine kinase/ligand-binding sensor domain-containing protein